MMRSEEPFAECSRFTATAGGARPQTMPSARSIASMILAAMTLLALLAGCTSRSPVAKPPEHSPLPPGNVVPSPKPSPAPPAPRKRPEFGEYMYVEELPEAVTKVPPVYPEEARKKGIEGVVLVQVLVLEDGTVGEWRIVDSVPMLDDAAVACVRQWRFKSAKTDGVPVAVWVAVPIRFTKQ